MIKMLNEDFSFEETIYNIIDDIKNDIEFELSDELYIEVSDISEDIRNDACYLSVEIKKDKIDYANDAYSVIDLVGAVIFSNIYKYNSLISEYKQTSKYKNSYVFTFVIFRH